MNSGWIKLHKKFLDWEWYQDHNTKILFIHLLLIVNWEKKNWKGIEILPGEIITGRKKLAKETGLSEQQIRTSLTRLKSTNEITITSTNKYTKLTLVKWDEYQSREKNQPTKQPTNEPTSNQQTTTTKEIKNKRTKDNNSGKAAKNQNFSSLSEILKHKTDNKRQQTTRWQEEAEVAANSLKLGDEKKSSIFKCYKDNPERARIAFNDCKELGKLHVLYFFRIYNQLIKK